MRSSSVNQALLIDEQQLDITGTSNHDLFHYKYKYLCFVIVLLLLVSHFISPLDFEYVTCSWHDYLLQHITSVIDKPHRYFSTP